MSTWPYHTHTKDSPQKVSAKLMKKWLKNELWVVDFQSITWSQTVPKSSESRNSNALDSFKSSDFESFVFTVTMILSLHGNNVVSSLHKCLISHVRGRTRSLNNVVLRRHSWCFWGHFLWKVIKCLFKFNYRKMAK